MPFAILDIHENSESCCGSMKMTSKGIKIERSKYIDFFTLLLSIELVQLSTILDVTCQYPKSTIAKLCLGTDRLCLEICARKILRIIMKMKIVCLKIAFELQEQKFYLWLTIESNLLLLFSTFKNIECKSLHIWFFLTSRMRNADEAGESKA